jgi:hypothetical protein
MASATGRPTLPVWLTVLRAYTTVSAHWHSVVRIFWAWLAIMGTLFAVWLWNFPGIRVAPLSNPIAPPSFVFLFAHVSLVVVGFLSFGSTAVAWHRLILLDERPPLVYLRVGRRVLRYLGRFLLIGLTALPVQLLSALLLYFFVHYYLGGFPVLLSPGVPPSTGKSLAMLLVGLIVLSPALLIIARLSVSLPAVALGRPIGFEDVWQLTEGNSLRLLGGTLLVYVPAYLLVYVPAYLLDLGLQFSVEPHSRNILPTLVSLSAYFFCTVAAVSFLSLSYSFFIPAPQGERPPSG